jgi:hypothetical protein
MAKPGITPRRGRKPRTKKVTIRSASHHLAGAEKPYPVYHFSARTFVERKGHNPFKGLQDPAVVESFTSGFSGGFQ